MNAGIPDVSVVIPAFNRASLIARAVQSCLNQSCAMEVLVVDDGSTDDIRDVVESHFQNQLSAHQIRLLHQANQGACAARNAGLACATGEFIKFLDSDDELLPNALTAEVNAARTAECEALLTGWEERTCAANGTEEIARRRTRSAPDLSHGIDDMLLGKAPCVHAALYRTAFIRPLRWDPAWTKAQDWGWALTVCLAGARFHSVALTSCIYNHHGGERITRQGDVVLRSTRARQGMLKMIERELTAQQALTDNRKHLLAQYYYRDAQVLARHDPVEWRRVWSHCQALCPSFRPVDPNRMVRALTRITGIHTGVRLYVALKRCIPAHWLGATGSRRAPTKDAAAPPDPNSGAHGSNGYATGKRP